MNDFIFSRTRKIDCPAKLYFKLTLDGKHYEQLAKILGHAGHENYEVNLHILY